MQDELEDDEDWYETDYEGDRDEDEDEDSESEPTRKCPYCRHEMLEMIVQCPSCGQYLSKEDVSHAHQPRWVVLSAVLCLGVLLFWLLVGF